MISSIEMRFLARHPWRWLRYFWLHLLLGGLMLTLAVAWTDPIFDQVAFAPYWPLMISWAGGLVIATAIAPLANRLVAMTGATLMTLGLLRAAALAEVYVFGAANRGVVLALMVKEVMTFCLGAVWPVWSGHCGTRATVEAGHDDRWSDGA